MKWLDVGWQAHGVVAIGQFATGVIAIGQVAWGVVAIGQAAFGGLAIGQLAVGAGSIGMVGVGLNGTIAMIGVGGRGFGFVVPLLPSLDLRLVPPGLRSLSAVRAAGDGGWCRLHLVPGEGGRIAVFDGFEPVGDVRIDARSRRAALTVAPGDVYARLRKDRRGWVADQLVRVAVPRWARPRWWLIWAAQLAGLMLLAAAFAWGVAEPVLRALSAP